MTPNLIRKVKALGTAGGQGGENYGSQRDAGRLIIIGIVDWVDGFTTARRELCDGVDVVVEILLCPAQPPRMRELLLKPH
ncbi:hypothetical protein VTN96DRAFT_5730 [Rasamsonia emersonii]